MGVSQEPNSDSQNSSEFFFEIIIRSLETVHVMRNKPSRNSSLQRVCVCTWLWECVRLFVRCCFSSGFFSSSFFFFFFFFRPMTYCALSTNMLWWEVECDACRFNRPNSTLSVTGLFVTLESIFLLLNTINRCFDFFLFFSKKKSHFLITLSQDSSSCLRMTGDGNRTQISNHGIQFSKHQTGKVSSMLAFVADHEPPIQTTSFSWESG